MVLLLIVIHREVVIHNIVISWPETSTFNCLNDSVKTSSDFNTLNTLEFSSAYWNNCWNKRLVSQ